MPPAHFNHISGFALTSLQFTTLLNNESLRAKHYFLGTATHCREIILPVISCVMYLQLQSIFFPRSFAVEGLFFVKITQFAMICPLFCLFFLFS